MKKALILLLFVCILVSGASALAQQEGVQITFIEKKEGGSSLRYPQLQGLPNTFVQDTINRAIFEKGGIALHEVTMTSPAQQGATGVQVSSDAYLLTKESQPAVLSLVILAEGKMPNGRLGYTATPMMFSLADGSEISPDVLWTDKQKAQDYLDAWVEDISQKDIFTYSDLSGAVPVPLDSVMLTDTGIRVYYPLESFTQLSGRAGAFSYYFYEVAGILQTGEDSLLGTLDAWKSTQVSSETKGLIESTLAGGMLPGIPKVMRQSIREVSQQYKELTDSEAFITGERHVLEDAVFRDVSLIVPFRGEEITGILTRRISLFGLETGRTENQAVAQVLGEPETTLPLDADTAAQYAMVAGTASFYSMGEYRLMLNFDTDGILQSVYLSKESSLGAST